MLSPKLKTFYITPEIRAKIEGKVIDALYRSIQELPPRRITLDGIPTLTVTEAKERLEVALPEYAAVVGQALSLGDEQLGLTAREFGKRLHEWINEASLFFRRDGADCIRQGLRLSNEEAFRAHVWNHLFTERLLTLAQSQNMLNDEGALQTCDLVVESMKLWTDHVCAHLSKYGADEFSPSAFFLDTEKDVQANLCRHGQQIHLRGKPDAIFFDQRRSEVHVWEYKFGRQGQFELQVAQVLLYMGLIESAKGIPCSSGCLTLFTVEEDEDRSPGPDGDRQREPSREFPQSVEGAFEGFIGNDQAVYLLKVQLTLALRQNPPRTPINVMLCGPGGTGKTDLARRVAKALGAPFVDVPASSVRNVDDLVEKVDKVLAQEAAEPEEDGAEGGLPRYRYPPVVIFLDEVHAIARRSDEFLNLFEPKERRAVCRNRVGDFHNATFLTATTDKGRLSSPFLSRFRILDLQPYTLEEVSRIAEWHFLKQDKPCPAEVSQLLAKMGRLIPRQVIERVKHFLDLHEWDSGQYPITQAGVHAAMSRGWNVDVNGLTPNDHEYLDALTSGPKGLGSLSAIVTCQREEIEKVIEPYLIRLGAVRLTSRGREITEMGRSILQTRDDRTDA